MDTLSSSFSDTPSLCVAERKSYATYSEKVVGSIKLNLLPTLTRPRNLLSHFSGIFVFSGKIGDFVEKRPIYNTHHQRRNITQKKQAVRRQSLVSSESKRETLAKHSPLCMAAHWQAVARDNRRAAQLLGMAHRWVAKTYSPLSSQMGFAGVFVPLISFCCHCRNKKGNRTVTVLKRN